MNVQATYPRMPSRTAGLLLGLGLGGFVDGIVLHQILQWHHMVSHVEAFPVGTVAGLEVNRLADGFFHMGTWLLVVAGSTAAIASWRRGRAPAMVGAPDIPAQESVLERPSLGHPLSQVSCERLVPRSNGGTLAVLPP